MEPQKPKEKLEMVERAEGTEAEAAEYEELLSRRFTKDPDAPMPESAQEDTRNDRSRLRALYRKFAKRLKP